MCTLESLPVELISDIFSELDLDTLIVVAQVSRRLNAVVSSPSLNPWRNPIRRLLSSQTYHTALKNLSVRRIVPRQNWIEILALTSPSFILFDATLPKLKEEEWKECFYRRFLPSWRRWSSQEATWKASFMQVLYRVWHRGRTSCTVDETWTKFVQFAVVTLQVAHIPVQIYRAPSKTTCQSLGGVDAKFQSLGHFQPNEVLSNALDASQPMLKVGLGWKTTS
ncbi:hypothetical protein PM082_005737 [Marasmius tenuissimus]|nr:hypothetical protein PM082_005737 [Marasmius tenuissimus]